MFNCVLAKVAKLVDALDLGSSAARRESSSLSFRTSKTLLTYDVKASHREAFVVFVVAIFINSKPILFEVFI